MKNLKVVKKTELVKTLDVSEYLDYIDVILVEDEDGNDTEKVDCIVMCPDLSAVEAGLANSLLNAIADEIDSEPGEEDIEPEDVDIIEMEEADEIYFKDGVILYYKTTLCFE